MSKRADLKEWTVCECHNQPIKRVNLPSHLKRVKRSARRQSQTYEKERSWFGRMVDRLMGHGSKEDAEKLRIMAEKLENQGD